MGTLHHLEPRAVDVGATLSQVALAERLGRDPFWVRRQGRRVRGSHGLWIETWEASYYRGGRLFGYTLLTLQDHPVQVSA